MERAQFDAFYRENIGLIRSVARKGYGRLQALGAAQEYDDLEQELTVTFLRAYDGFDESHGVRFSSYFTRAALNRVNRIAERVELERLGREVKRVSKDGETVDEEVYHHGGVRSFEELRSPSMGDDMSVEESIADDAPPATHGVEMRQLIDYVERRASPLAIKMLHLLASPPPEIERELEAGIAHAEYARSKGVKRRARPDLTFGLIATVLRAAGVSRLDLDRAKSELQKILKEGGYAI